MGKNNVEWETEAQREAPYWEAEICAIRHE